ncbi:hypothetical protein [Noviherbaspirillum galbum]|uniref:Uncharacterized protein n=1 Tax=Noviherbaspirillum galbum TaxID=2709383 RepID=A0A6B3SR11_9BURK|nr:hypothetical protein [Noviherbaspirillum galbum]NEX63193.1 hypothetical protein [Noviherbaspirillum galbum]
MNAWLSAMDDAQRQAPEQDAQVRPVQSSFQFRYARTEIVARGGQAHVRHHEARYEDGRLVREECEGTLDPAAWERMVEENQRLFARQVESVLSLWSLPFGGWRR